MIDMHVHFFPPRLFDAIWRYFEERGNGLWTVRYHLSGPEHVAFLKAAGVERFPSLVYAHKPGLADHLNAFVRESAQRHPEIIPFGTLYAGDGEVADRARRLFDDHGFAGIKLHPFVSGEELDDPRFFPAYERMEATGRILICHPGSGPVYARRDGARRLAAVLRAFPRLKVVVAHCGAFEFGDYPALADAYPGVYFDTAMNCVQHEGFRENCPGRAFFQRYSDRILFGSDFPNLPYDYAHQVRAIEALGLDEAATRGVFRDNALRLLDDSGA